MVTAWAGLLHAWVSFGSTEHTHLALSCGAEHSQSRTATAHDFYFCAAYSAESGLRQVCHRRGAQSQWYRNSVDNAPECQHLEEDCTKNRTEKLRGSDAKHDGTFRPSAAVRILVCKDGILRSVAALPGFRYLSLMGSETLSFYK